MQIAHFSRPATRPAPYEQPSGHRPEGFCCSVMVKHDVCHYSEVDERSARLAVYAHRGAQAVLKRPSEHRGTR